MSPHRPTISTHVLDTADGTPRVGVHVRVRLLAGDGSVPIVGEGVTDEDGRIRDLLGGGMLEAGTYRLEFALDPAAFFVLIALEIRVDDATRSYHVPLLSAPFGLTAYRGS